MLTATCPGRGFGVGFEECHIPAPLPAPDEDGGALLKLEVNDCQVRLYMFEPWILAYIRHVSIYVSAEGLASSYRCFEDRLQAALVVLSSFVFLFLIVILFKNYMYVLANRSIKFRQYVSRFSVVEASCARR